MYFLFSIVPATLAIVLGYFILFSSTKTQGAVKTFGRVLAIWIFILAAVFPAAGAYATYAGLPSMAEMMRSMHSAGSPRQ